jgi:hypothetical protein
MMKQLVWMGAVVLTVGGAAAWAQEAGGHTTPLEQPGTAPPPDQIPSGEMALGSVNISRAVQANGERLAAGTYQVRLTGDNAAAPQANGAIPALERWVEFVRGGKVVGREVATIIPQSQIEFVQKDPPPASNSAKVELLRGGDYLRVWINRGGNHFLLHLPVAA